MSPTTDSNGNLLENLRLELRRGCLVLAVLAELRTEQYGYTLRKGRKEGGRFEILSPGEVRAVLPRLRQISDEWLEKRSAKEKGFSLATIRGAVNDALAACREKVH